MRHLLFVCVFALLFATPINAQIDVLKQGFADWEFEARKQIQCILRQRGLYDGDLDGVYGPGTEAGLLAAYSAIGPERVHQGRGGLNNDREVYYFLYGFIDENWGYELFSTERLACLVAADEEGQGISYSITRSECGHLSDRNITVFPDRLEFWESSCSIKSSERVSANTYMLSLSCSGEGEIWARHERMSLFADGRLGFGGQTYLRCPG
jgi:hypothetical protein